MIFLARSLQPGTYEIQVTGKIAVSGIPLTGCVRVEDHEAKWEVLKSELAAEFAKYGLVESIQYKFGKGGGPTIVEYNLNSNADKAVAALNGKTFSSKVVGDYKLFVTRAEEHLQRNKRSDVAAQVTGTVLLSGIPTFGCVRYEDSAQKWEVVRRELEAEFAKYGNVLSFEFIDDFAGNPSRVTYSLASDADKAVAAMKGKTFSSEAVDDYRLWVRRG